jgi:hypothetical protein
MLKFETNFLASSSPVPILVRRIALVVLVVCIFVGVASVFDRFEQLSQLSQTYYRSYLIEAGISDRFYIWFFLGLECLVALTFAIIGSFIILNKSANWMMLFAGITMVTFGITVPLPLHTMIIDHNSMSLSLRIMRAIGLALFIIFFYLFPNGRFVPRWTSGLAIVLVLWSMVWPFYPPANPYEWPSPFPFLVLLGWFTTGVLAQLYRYTHVSNPEQQQQTKWIVFSLTIAVLGDFISHSPWYLNPSLHTGPDFWIKLIHHPFFVFSQLLVPLSIGGAILRYGLWEIDFIINRTLVYGLLTTLIASIWAVTQAVVRKLLETGFDRVAGQQLPEVLATGLTVLAVGSGFATVREKLETFVNHYFYSFKLDLGKDFLEFLPEARTSISMSELLNVLTQRILEVLPIAHGAVFLCDSEQQMELVESQNITPSAAQSLEWNNLICARLRSGIVIQRRADRLFPLLVPLILQRVNQAELIGVLALGYRQDERQYSLDELWAFKRLATQAGSAIHIAQLNTANHNELKQQLIALEMRIEMLETSSDKFVKPIYIACSNCSCQNPINVQFCTKCGGKLNEHFEDEPTKC